MKSNEMMVQILLKESGCDTLTKMLVAYILNMPHNDKLYYQKIEVVVEFLEQCLPAHPGAFAAFFRILDKLPATVNRKLPDGMYQFVEDNIAEIEKYYEGELPKKYRKSNLIVPDNRLVDAAGQVIGETPKGLQLV